MDDFEYLLNGDGNDTTPQQKTPQQNSQGDSLEATPLMNTASNFAKLDSLRHGFDTRKKVKKTQFIGGLFPRGYVSTLVGAPGTGKTILIQKIAHDLSLGGNILNGFAHEDNPVKSIIISGEFQEEGLIERAQLFDWHSDSHFMEVIDTLDFEKEGFSFTLTEHDGKTNLEHIAADCDILFIDSFGALFGGKENDNSELIRAFRFLMQLASKYNIAIVLVHHARKRLSTEQTKPLTLDDVIGGNVISRYSYRVIAAEFRHDIHAVYVRSLKSWSNHIKPFSFKVRNNIYNSGSYLDINLDPGEIDLETLSSKGKKTPTVSQPSQAEIQRGLITAFLKGKGQATIQEIKDTLSINENDDKSTHALYMTLNRMFNNGEIIKPNNKRGFYALPETEKPHEHTEQQANEETRIDSGEEQHTD